jgi:hypothetical protein
MKKFWKYIFPPLYGLLVYFTIRLLLDSVSGMKFWHRGLLLNAIEITTSAIMGYTSACSVILTRNGKPTILPNELRRSFCMFLC